MNNHQPKNTSLACILCQIEKGEINSQVLYKDSDVFAINDINPRAPIHILIIPVKHIEFNTINKIILLDIFGKLSVIARKLAKRNSVMKNGYRLTINQGNNAGQTISHLHMHLIGGKQLGPEG
jgi:histidine triad (HIT) family protein